MCFPLRLVAPRSGGGVGRGGSTALSAPGLELGGHTPGCARNRPSARGQAPRPGASGMPPQSVGSPTFQSLLLLRLRLHSGFLRFPGPQASNSRRSPDATPDRTAYGPSSPLPSAGSEGDVLTPLCEPGRPGKRFLA